MRRLPPGLDAVRTALSRRGAPSAYVDRLLGELAEHREDLIDELLQDGLTPDAAAAEADRRIGEPTTITEAAVSALRGGSWIGRHPVLSFVFMPAVTLPLCWAATLLIVAWTSGMLSPSFRVGTLSGQARAALSVACAACAYGVPAAAGAAFYLLARRMCFGTVWACMPSLVLAIISSFAFVSVVVGGSPAAAGRIVVGVNDVPDPLKLLPPLSVASLLLLLPRRASATVDCLPQG